MSIEEQINYAHLQQKKINKKEGKNMLWRYRKQIAYIIATIVAISIYCPIVGAVNILGFTYLNPGIERLTLSFLSPFIGLLPAYAVFYALSRIIHVKLTWMNV